MGDGVAGKRDGNQVFLGGLNSLADGFGDFGGLAETIADFSFAVAHDDQRRELHHATALDGLGDAVQGNDFFDILALFAFKSGHLSFLLP